MEKTIHSSEQAYLRQFLIAMRKNAGLTQRQLAARLAREHSFIARIELGERRLDLLEFRQYCRACEVSPVQAAKRLMSALDRQEKKST